MSQDGQNQQQQPEHATPFLASETFIQSLANQVNQHDVDTLLQAQRLMLLRFEKTNEMLINCNALSAVRFQSACQEFKRHTQQLLEMKKDLDSVFRRIRVLRTKLAVQYPAAFEACSNVYNVLEEEIEDEQQPSTTKSASETEQTIVSEQQHAVSNPQSSSCSQTTTPSPATSPSTSDTG